MTERAPTTEWPGGWPPSNYPILFAILLLVGTAVALVVSTERTANELATYAYYLLVVGVAIRLVEHAAEERLRRGLTTLLSSARRGIGQFRRRASTSAHRVSYRIDVPSLPNPATEAADAVGRDSLRERSPLADSTRREQVRDVAAYTFGATLLGGFVVLASRLTDPFVVISREFMLGWFAVLALLAGAYVVAR